METDLEYLKQALGKFVVQDYQKPLTPRELIQAIDIAMEIKAQDDEEQQSIMDDFDPTCQS